MKFVDDVIVAQCGSRPNGRDCSGSQGSCPSYFEST